MRAVQLNLFSVPSPRTDGANFRDPACIENKQLPVHRWVPWIAGYSAHFVDDVISAYGIVSPGNVQRPLVLDPFAGVGTTLVQAMLRGCATIGFEINPYAALAARVKVRAPLIDLKELYRTIETCREASHRWRSETMRPRSHPPHGFRSRIPFFSPAIERQVLWALDFVSEIETPDVQDLFRVALGSTMVSFSNYSYEPSLGTRISAGKSLIEDADVATALLAKIEEMAADIRWVQEQLGKEAGITRHEVVNRDFISTSHSYLANGSVDLAVTSPPYMNNYHYVRNTRPQLFWLSLVRNGDETRRLEEHNFGKFWQTVRSAPPVKVEFEHGTLNTLIGELRQIRADQGPYGGPGWANYVAAYFNDCNRFLKTLTRVLRRDGIGVIVIGNSIIQGIEFKVDILLAQLAERHNFHVEEVRIIREKRIGASITQSAVRRGNKSKAILYESAVIVRKR